MDTITSAVGARVRAFRLARGLTQEELAERAELHNTYIGQIERGEKNLSIVSLDKILTALGVSFSEFFEFVDLKRTQSGVVGQCCEIINQKSPDRQEHFLKILQELDLLTK